MSFEQQPPAKEESVTSNQALTQLEALKARIAPTGNVDDEMHQIEQLIMKVQSGAITPDEALKKASELVNSRQSYH